MPKPEMRSQMFLDQAVTREAETLAKNLLETGKTSGSFQPSSQTTGEKPEFFVQKNQDGIMPLGNVVVNGKRFFVGQKIN